MTGSESPPTVGYVVSRWPRLSHVAPHDPEMLADALDLLLADADLRDRLAQAARRTIEAHFAIERNSTELVTLFQRGGRAR